MAEITRARTGQMVRKIFEILLPLPDGLKAKDILEKLSKELPPTEFENSTYPTNPDVRRFEKIARFSTIAPVKAGWLIKNKGSWSLTEVGRKAFDKYKDPEQFQKEAGLLYKQWAKGRPEDPVIVDSPEANASTTYEEAEEKAWAEIYDYLRTMNPYDFQELVKTLLIAMGYFVNWIAPPGQDGGIDLIADPDPLGTKNPRIKVQVKRWGDKKVDVDGIRSFIAVLGDQEVGLYVALGGFTSNAEKEARQKETRKITLIDSEKLFDLWEEFYSKLPESGRRLLPIRKISYLAPREE